MKDYNQEYFFIRRKGINYPLIDYINWPDSDIDFLKDIYNEGKIIPFKYGDPIPDKPELGDLHGCGYKLIISNRLKEQLETMNLKKVQFIPATIQNQAEEIVDGYYIIHVHHFIQAMDKNNSDWKKDRKNPDRAVRINKIVLDNNYLEEIPLEDRLVFALKEHPLTTVYHRSVVEKMLTLQPTGVGVYCLADWDGSNPFEDEFREYVMS